MRPLRGSSLLLVSGVLLLHSGVMGAINPGPRPRPVAKTPLPANEVAGSVNLLPNSSFERTLGDEAPEYWGRSGDYLPSCPEWRVVEENAFDGRKCLLSAPGQELLIPAETSGLPEDGYVFSVYLRAARPGARCRLTLMARPDVDDGRSPWQSWDRTVQLTTSWKRYSLPAKIDRHLDKNRWGIEGGLFACGITPLDEGVFVDAAQLERSGSATPYAPSVEERRGELPAWPSRDGLQRVCEGLQETPEDHPDRRSSGKVKILVSRPRETERAVYPVSGGVLFPRGVLFDRARVRLFAPDGRPVVLQTEALARYGADASIRSLYVAFPADLGLVEHAVYTLAYNVSPAEIATPLRVVESTDAVRVITGPLKLTMLRRGFSLFDGIWLDVNGDGTFDSSERLVDGTKGGGLSVVDDDGKAWRSRLDEPLLVVERAGPVEVVVRARGWHASEDGRGHLAYTVRVYAYAGEPYLKVEHSFANLDRALTTQLRAISVRIPLRGVRAYSSPETGKRDLSRPARFLQTRRGFDFRWQLVEGTREVARGDRLSGLFSAELDGAAMAVAVPNFWQTHPKEVVVDRSGVTINLWPRRGVKMLSLTRGVARTHEVFLCFSRPGDTRIVAKLKTVAKGIRPFADPAWSTSTGAVGAGLPVEESPYPVFETLLGQHFDLAGPAARAQGLSGLFDFGDTLSSGGFWLNNETARPRAYLVQYLRTGDRDVFEIGEQAVVHLMDVDTDQISGGQHVHCIHHAMGRPNCSHNYANMGALYYLITGKRWALERARKNGDALVKWAGRKLSGRGMGWTMWGLADLWDLTREERFRYWGLDLARRLEESVQVKAGKRTSLSKGGFLYGGTCLNGLMRLHQGTGDSAVKALFLDEQEAIVESAVQRNRLVFRGRDCMMFAPLAYAFDLTGDRRYVDWGVAGLYARLPFERAPGFDFVLASVVLARAARLRLPEPVSAWRGQRRGPDFAETPLLWGFKRRHSIYVLDERDDAFTITVFKGGGKEGSWIKVYAPDGEVGTTTLSPPRGEPVASRTYESAERETDTIRIRKDGRRGAYRVDVNQAYPTTVNLAFSLPKVVLEIDRTMFRMAGVPARYFFFVPEGTSRFRIGVVQQWGKGDNGVVVCDPDGHVVKRHRWPDEPGRAWQSLEIRPSYGQQRRHGGGLWSILVAVSGQFKMEFDGVPPYVSHRPESHFVPEVGTE